MFSCPLTHALHPPPNTHSRKAGYGSYGPPDGWQRGARVILLREGEPASSSKTWLRLQDGSRLAQSSSDKSWWKPWEKQCVVNVCLAPAVKWGPWHHVVEVKCSAIKRRGSTPALLSLPFVSQRPSPRLPPPHPQVHVRVWSASHRPPHGPPRRWQARQQRWRPRRAPTHAGA